MIILLAGFNKENEERNLSIINIKVVDRLTWVSVGEGAEPMWTFYGIQEKYWTTGITIWITCT